MKKPYRKYPADSSIDLATTVAVAIGYFVAAWLFLPNLGFPQDLILAAVLGTVTGLIVGIVRSLWL